MSIHDEHYLRIQRLYNKADKFVGIDHRIAADKFQIFGRDAMERLGKVNLQKMMVVRKAMFFKCLNEALVHYIESDKKSFQAESTQITAFFLTKDGKKWLSNLKYCVWFLTKSRSKQATNAALELFSQYPKSERRLKLESMTQIRAFVAYIHFMAKDIQNANVVKIDFKQGKRI